MITNKVQVNDISPAKAFTPGYLMNA
jgi:hypothetical protein